jgi:hypothetical protein
MSIQIKHEDCCLRKKKNALLSSKITMNRPKRNIVKQDYKKLNDELVAQGIAWPDDDDDVVKESSKPKPKANQVPNGGPCRCQKILKNGKQCSRIVMIPTIRTFHQNSIIQYRKENCYCSEHMPKSKKSSAKPKPKPKSKKASAKPKPKPNQVPNGGPCRCQKILKNGRQCLRTVLIPTIRTFHQSSIIQYRKENCYCFQHLE